MNSKVLDGNKIYVQVTVVKTPAASLVAWLATLPAKLVTSEAALPNTEVASERIEPPRDPNRSGGGVEERKKI